MDAEAKLLGRGIQYVCIYNIKSELLPITSCLPQGSVLGVGPLFFQIYINNDLTNCICTCHC